MEVNQSLEIGYNKFNDFVQKGDDYSMLAAIRSFIKANKEVDFDDVQKISILYYIALCHATTKDYEMAYRTTLKAIAIIDGYSPAVFNDSRLMMFKKHWKDKILTIKDQLVSNHSYLRTLSPNNYQDFNENDFKFLQNFKAIVETKYYMVKDKITSDEEAFKIIHHSFLSLGLNKFNLSKELVLEQVVNVALLLFLKEKEAYSAEEKTADSLLISIFSNIGDKLKYVEVLENIIPRATMKYFDNGKGFNESDISKTKIKIRIRFREEDLEGRLRSFFLQYHGYFPYDRATNTIMFKY